MKLSEFRILFANITGRFDLVSEDGKDQGIDFYVNAGHRMLDRMFTHSQSVGELEGETKIGQAVYSLPGVLSIKNVQMVSSDSERFSLRKADSEEVNTACPTGNGLPTWYSVVTGLRSPILGNSSESFQKLSIKLYATPDAAYTFFVEGRLTKTLKGDEDVSFWTVNYPETLIRATQYQIETFHRNRAGAADFMSAILEDLRQIDGDLIETEVADLNQMRDSFNFRGQGNAR